MAFPIAAKQALQTKKQRFHFQL